MSMGCRQCGTPLDGWSAAYVANRIGRSRECARQDDVAGSPPHYAAMVALFGFIAILVALVMTLISADPISGWLMLAYLVWVVGFDLPWIVRLWHLNRATGRRE